MKVCHLLNSNIDMQIFSYIERLQVFLITAIPFSANVATKEFISKKGIRTERIVRGSEI